MRRRITPPLLRRALFLLLSRLLSAICFFSVVGQRPAFLQHYYYNVIIQLLLAPSCMCRTAASCWLMRRGRPAAPSNGAPSSTFLLRCLIRRHAAHCGGKSSSLHRRSPLIYLVRLSAQERPPPNDSPAFSGPP